MDSENYELFQNLNVRHFQLEQNNEWYPQLLSTGCVILKNIFTKEEVQKAQNYFWDWLENLGTGIKKADPNTWNNQNWPSSNLGFFVSYGGCHTWTSWMVRTHPKVKQAFSKIWNTQKLITSFDTIISWRPWWNLASKGKWNPHVQNLHLDQNPSFKKGLHCVQGMMPLKRVRESQVGGLQIVPHSNSQKAQEQIIQRYPNVQFDSSDWLQLSSNDPLIGKGQLVECEAGDLVLWDSRTVHGGKICSPSQEWKKDNQNQLVRLAVTVTMVPSEWCSQESHKRRRQFFANRIGTTHWPQQTQKNPMGKMVHRLKSQSITYKYPELTPEIEDLI